MSHNVIKLYRHPQSDEYHCVELMLSLLGLQTEVVSVDLMRGGYRIPEFLAGSNFGQVPFIDDDGTVVAECNAILVYLAATYGDGQWLPSDHLVLAKVLCWLSLTEEEVGSKEASTQSLITPNSHVDVEDQIIRTLALVNEINLALAVNKFLVSGEPTIADISAYIYITHVPNASVSLFDYPLIREWLTTISSLPRFVSVQHQKRVNAQHDWNFRS